MAQVFRNLLSNALKFTTRGEVVLEVTPVEAQPHHLRVEVRDTGIGISADACARLFERFYRVDKARSRGTGGTGLGLAIVKHIVNRHRGALRPESEVGRGTTFRVLLPRAGEI